MYVPLHTRTITYLFSAVFLECKGHTYPIITSVIGVNIVVGSFKGKPTKSENSRLLARPLTRMTHRTTKLILLQI